MAFIHTEIYKYDAFAIDDRGNIWRIYFNGIEGPFMQKLMSDALEYYNVIRLLRAKANLYK